MKTAVQVLATVASLAAGMAFAQTPGNVPADNSRSNKVESSNRAATADDQSNSSSDVEMTRRIRESVMDEKGLSTYAKNVKIVVVGGKVTLNGVVRTDAEKKLVGTKATAVAGGSQVTNLLKVEPVK